MGLVSIAGLTCTLATTGCGSDARSNGSDRTQELPDGANHTTSLSQYGVNFTFASEVEAGKFANGDYWVVGPVTIASVTPECDGEHHGWMA